MRRLLGKMGVLLALSAVVLGCAPVAPAFQNSASAGGDAAAGATTLTIFAAASLTDAFNEIGAVFVADHPNTELIFNFAGSNQLATQIGEGAPADVFASANLKQMQVAIESGRILTDAQRIFAHNRLVVVTPSDNPAGLTELQGLATPGVKIVFAAKEVPVGQYSLDFLEKAGASESLGADFKAAVMANLVSYEQNVRAVLAKVALGEADAGIVYRSDVTASEQGAVSQIEIPDNLNTIANYPIAAVNDSPNLALAQAFVDTILAPAGQQILTQYGFVPASQ
ncbi:MAG: molybdate ABC transporter substrate-binding protein [Caldilineaceae bacterium]|jgi:molybdate transport system substrate-binding protein|nr:molybdate ABC transporter substrate-binding protein [Caldilineaceae bacterium]